jgi:hypothetical protein
MIAIVTYDLSAPYDYTTANKLMEEAGFSRYFTDMKGQPARLNNTTWMSEMPATETVAEARDGIVAKLKYGFLMANLDARFMVFVAGDTWAVQMMDVESLSTAIRRRLGA